MASGKRDKQTPTLFPARTALNDGDFKRAHTLAVAVTRNPQAGEDEKQDAVAILDATRIDRVPVYVGAGVVCVLAVLFSWVLSRAHTGM